jgi:Protein of unknown function (DUF992)
MRYRSLIVASVIGLTTATVASAEQARTNLGVLTCTVVNPAKDEGQKMTCGFKPAGSGAEEKYSGNVRGSEQDLPSGKVVLVWTVVGPADGKIGAGILSQRYIRAKGTSGEVPMLVGEKNPAIVLQSETNNGSAAYASITQIELELTGTPA